MRLLIDTHIALWTVARPDRVPKRAADLMLDPDNQVFVSSASVWEVAIKHKQRRTSARDAVVSGTHFLELVHEAGLDLLPVTGLHAAEVDRLPNHHNDPFDRILVAQARAEPMHLVTVDAELSSYGACVLLV